MKSWFPTHVVIASFSFFAREFVKMSFSVVKLQCWHFICLWSLFRGISLEYILNREIGHLCGVKTWNVPHISCENMNWVPLLPPSFVAINYYNRGTECDRIALLNGIYDLTFVSVIVPTSRLGFPCPLCYMNCCLLLFNTGLIGLFIGELWLCIISYSCNSKCYLIWRVIYAVK